MLRQSGWSGERIGGRRRRCEVQCRRGTGLGVELKGGGGLGGVQVGGELLKEGGQGGADVGAVGGVEVVGADGDGGGREVAAEEFLADAGEEQAVDAAGVLEADLDLGRVNVYVHVAGGDGDE